jgi:general secretion pathway protein N
VAASLRRGRRGGERTWGPGRVLLYGFLGVVVALATFLATAPATLIDWGLARGTDGRVRLADAEGSIWSGQGRLVLVDLVTEAERGNRGARRVDSLAGVVIPGTIRWRVSPLPLFIGRLQASASHESMATPVTLTGNARRLQGTGGSLQLPSVNLARLGSPWTTVRPTASLAVQWQPFVIEQGRFVGQATLELRDVASALTPVRPLGAYRITIDGTGASSRIQMSSIEGPLRLSGNGTWTPQTGLRFTAYAQADEAEQMRLQSLLGLLGRREGARTLIRIGA